MSTPADKIKRLREIQESERALLEERTELMADLSLKTDEREYILSQDGQKVVLCYKSALGGAAFPLSDLKRLAKVFLGMVEQPDDASLKHYAVLDRLGGFFKKDSFDDALHWAKEWDKTASRDAPHIPIAYVALGPDGKPKDKREPK